ncbi:HAD family phosphatase [Anaerococcus sp. mt242]|mgnify:FL=1|uniref:Cof-type HAD-IIB family hydrolase n=1 Tax=Anaerococcus sp. mt242 TaxID=2661917 RepID=UPI0019343CFB|nr:Cof-type HAD-IIB family hydrolase [Anaerococcus sp. mt242]MBM0046508.1 HAD family phosphatase [Anaerococcus sp. mt242]
MNKDIKLVAIDLDGTLLGSDREVVEKNIDAIKKIHDKGIKVVIATGRCFNGFWWVRQALGLEGFDDYSICNTGAFIRCNATGKAIVENPLDKSDYEKITSYLKDYDLQVGIFTKDVLYNNEEVVNNGFKTDQEVMRLPRQKFKDFDDIEEKVARINFMGDEAELDKFYEKNKEALEKDYMTMRNETYSLEILKKSSGKANSLKKLCEFLDIDLENVAYFGDGANDIESIKLAGLGIAMANAKEETKEAADYVTSSNDEAGVAKFLEKLFD